MLPRLTFRARSAKQSDVRAITERIGVLGGVNLSQGLCNIPAPAVITDAAKQAIQQGHNSYSSCLGIDSLRLGVAERYKRFNGLPIDQENILITSGATGAFESICKAFLEENDEVLMFQPSYPYHVRQVRDRGAIPRFLDLNPPDWKFSQQQLEDSFSEKTKLLVFSNPNNPTGKVFSREELICIGNACKERGVIAVVDEVYEYITSEGKKHVSLASFPEFFQNTLTMSSASKTFFVTGWRIGWICGPADIIPAISVRFDDSYICAPSPFQHAVAHAFHNLDDAFFGNIKTGFETKRVRLQRALAESGFRTFQADGGCYILAEYSKLGYSNDLEMASHLVENALVAAVPGSSFYEDQRNTGFLRFCFAVVDQELEKGALLLEEAQLIRS